MDWNTVAAQTREAFRLAVNEWITAARFDNGRINGPNLQILPGGLQSPISLEAKILPAMTKAGVPPRIATPLSQALASAWSSWAAGFQLTALAFPTFAAVPGPVAPPTPSVPILLRNAASPGESFLRSSVLSATIIQSLQSQRSLASGDMLKAINSLAQWVDMSFQEWKANVVIVGMIGQGSVPTFAPPYVPVGPVSQGSLVTGPVFAGPRFGRVVAP